MAPPPAHWWWPARPPAPRSPTRHRGGRTGLSPAGPPPMTGTPAASRRQPAPPAGPPRPVQRRARRVVGALALGAQPAGQLRRQLRKEAPRQGVIHIPVGHAYDVRPDWNPAKEKPDLGNH